MTQKTQTKKHWVISELPQLLLLVAVILSARSSFADHYLVPTGSMEYTLMPGDRVVVDKSAYGIRLPFTHFEIIERDAVRRGEVVIFDSPKDGTRLIKRIVAIGGDQISMRNGKLMINGVVLGTSPGFDTEKFGERLATLNLQHGGGPDIPVSIIPKGKLLAVGDNRGRSHDGRYFGLVGEEEIYGRAAAVYYRRNEGFVWRKL